jgi:hypothetical protein
MRRFGVLLVVIGLSAVLATGVFGAAGSAQPRWSIKDLGMLGGSISDAAAINTTARSSGRA